jgi:hypothetical protein
VTPWGWAAGTFLLLVGVGVVLVITIPVTGLAPQRRLDRVIELLEEVRILAASSLMEGMV